MATDITFYEETCCCGGYIKVTVHMTSLFGRRKAVDDFNEKHQKCVEKLHEGILSIPTVAQDTTNSPFAPDELNSLELGIVQQVWRETRESHIFDMFVVRLRSAGFKFTRMY